MTLLNLTISSLNHFRYSLTEPVKLRLARRGWKDGPLVSVYIPTYNRPRLLVERGMQSVLDQTYPNFELIIVADDGSLENDTWKNVWGRAEYDRRIQYYCLPQYKHLDGKNGWLVGPTRPANYALGSCSGQWIARNDDDDEWTPDHLEKLLKFAREGDYEFVSAAQKWVYPDREEIKTWQDDMGITGKIGGIQTTLYRSYLKCFKFNRHCWRKKWNCNNDIDLPVRMFKAGVRMGFLNDIVTIVKPRPGETEIGLKAI